MPYYTPSDTGDLLTDAVINHCGNFGLIIQRLAPRDAVDNPTNDTGPSPRYSWLNWRCEKFTLDDRLVNGSAKRWYAMTEGAARFAMITCSRLVVGLGGKGAMEFGLTLHRVTGLPYIPGSALKGACRNYMLLTIAARHEVPVESSALEILDGMLCGGDYDDADAELYRRAFGTQTQSGEIVFHDAILLPSESDSLKLFSVDVMTPHFSAYYGGQGKVPPSNDMGPKPVFFPTVNEGIGFGFAVGTRHNATLVASDVEAIKTHLQNAVALLGIGAKTAAGYGVMVSDSFDFRRFKGGFEIGDEIKGEVYDTSDGLLFLPDNPYDSREVEAHIPKDRKGKNRKAGEVVWARITAIKDGDPLLLTCDQIDKSKK